MLAFWLKDLLAAVLAENLPMVPAMPVDLRVLAFNLGLALVCGIAFGLAPALQAARIPVNESLKATGRNAGESGGRGRLRDLLVVAEVALAMALLIGAGLLFRSFLALRGMDSGMRADRILTLDLQLKGGRYADPQSQAAFFHDAMESVRGVPGVESVAVTTIGGASLGIEGRPDAEADGAWSIVSPDYFRTMGIPLLRGRNFSDSDNGSAPEVAIVSQLFARRYFPNEDCIGRRLESLFTKNGWTTIVGTVGDIRPEPQADPGPAIYTFYLQQGHVGGNDVQMTLLVRTAGDPMRLARAVRSRLAAIDRTQAPVRIETLEQSNMQSIAPTARQHGGAGLVCAAGAAVGIGGRLRSDGARGRPAHARDRHSHGAGSGLGRYHCPDPGARPSAGGSGRSRRHRRRAGAEPGNRQHALPCGDD